MTRVDGRVALVPEAARGLGAEQSTAPTAGSITDAEAGSVTGQVLDVDGGRWLS